MQPIMTTCDLITYYEKEIIRNPSSLDGWWRYLIACADYTFEKRFIIYERALKALPESYKLWHAYLRERLQAVGPLPVSNALYSPLNDAFKRALVTMHKMPCIWSMYLQTLIDQQLLTLAQESFYRALRTLPFTQHHHIWSMYLCFVAHPGNPVEIALNFVAGACPGVPIETALRVYSRYLMFDPPQIENLVEFLNSSSNFLRDFLNDGDSFHSMKDKTKHQLWLQLCHILTEHATQISRVKMDDIICGDGIRRFTNEIGRLWALLTGYYLRRGLYEKASDVIEEWLGTVVTVRDFSVILDCYAQLDDSASSAKMMALDGSNDEEEGGEGDEGRDGRLDCNLWVEKLGKSILHGFWLNNDDDDDDVGLKLSSLEQLMNRMPELVNSILLRQNPHNVNQWHRRVKLFEGNPAKQILTFVEAVTTVDPMKAVGKPQHTLWVAFARLYENHNNIVNVRVIFEKAVQVNYKTVDDLASVWCEWAEMELRHNNFQGAMELMRRATAEPSVEVKLRVAPNGNEPVQMKLHKSLRLWAFYADLELSFGTLESTRAAYERILDLNIATPQIIMKYALLLEENNYLEDPFEVYQRGVEIFNYPHAKDLWLTYLSKFVKRHGKTELDHARLLFELAVQEAPAEDLKSLYLQYVKLEEAYGNPQREMKVYHQATMVVPDQEKVNMYEIYIARATEIFGVQKASEIYQEALQSGLPYTVFKTICMKYAKFLKSLGEIDHAREIYFWASKYADPRTDDFWNEVYKFEFDHGNEDTFQEMLSVMIHSGGCSYNQARLIVPEYLKLKYLSKYLKRDLSCSEGKGKGHLCAPEAIKRQRQGEIVGNHGATYPLCRSSNQG